MKGSSKRSVNHEARSPAAAGSGLFQELVAHLRLNGASLCEEWARRIQKAKLLTSMSGEEIFAEATAVYRKYVQALETGNVKDLQAYARDLSRRIINRGVETHEVLGIVLLLRDVMARSLFRKYHGDCELLNRIFDAYEPAANRIANTVAVSFVEQRERIIRRQQKAIQILHVQEEERKRISRELHDEVGQALTAINTHLALVQRDCLGERESLFKTGIANVENLLVGVIDRMHSFARDLRPAALDDLGLLPALRSYLKDFAERTGLLVRFERAARDAQLNSEQKTALFRIAQESLANVAKHAQATEVVVTLGFAKGGIQLRIKDNGKGFAPKQRQSAAESERLGLLGIQERVRLLKGRCMVQSAPGRGTTVVVEIPLAADRATVALDSVSVRRNEGFQAY
jgi:signal transduction histidine kinase